MIDRLGERAAHRLFELLGYLPYYGHLTLGAHCFGELFEALDHAVRRFVDDDRARFVGECRNAFCTTLFCGRNPSKQNLSHGNPLCTTAGIRAVAPGSVSTSMPSSTQVRTSRNPGSEMPGVPASLTRAYVASAGYGVGDLPDGRMLVELVVRVHAFLDAEMFEQYCARARVLGEDEVYRPEGVYGAKRNVVEIAYRRGYDV